MATATDNGKYTEKNPVAENYNWEQRVDKELDLSNDWFKNWGVLYCPDAPDNLEDRIKALQEKLSKSKCQDMYWTAARQFGSSGFPAIPDLTPKKYIGSGAIPIDILARQLVEKRAKEQEKKS